MLLRHGRTGDNHAGRFQGSLDTPLDDVGRAQAVAAAQVLARELPPAVLVTSDLVRAADTAREVAGVTGLTARVEARLQELHLGSWQGLTSAQAQAAYADEHAAWLRGEDVARGGGETYRQAGERAVAALREHLPETGTLLAVTHGGTARAAVGLLLELPDATWWRLAPLGNCCWSVLVEGARGWRLEQHGTRALAEARAL